MSPAVTDKLELLRDLPVFTACSRRELRLLARLTDLISVGAGTVLVDQGMPGHEFFTIARGHATVVRDGREVAVLGAGESFGEVALLASAPRDATVVSNTDMELVVIEERAFLGLLAEVPTLSRHILGRLATRLHASEAGALSQAG
jgi:CRP-like cAMP-binding protein